MSSNNSQTAYQQAAVRNASAIDLVIMLYDILARDLQQAVAATEAKDVETRTARVKHALLVLQQLEGSLNMEAGDVLASSLSRLYTMVRKQVMEAQVRQDAAILREVIQLLFSVREAWVQVNVPAGTAPANQPPSPSAPGNSGGSRAADHNWRC